MPHKKYKVIIDATLSVRANRMKNLTLILTSLATCSLIACGGGGSDSDTPSKQSSSSLSSASNSSSSAGFTAVTQTGYLLDSALINADYQTATHSGVTGDAGEFYYEPGETVSFSIGDLSLGAVSGQTIVTPLTLTNSESSSAQAVRNMARLLQTLDKDGTPSNGIRITSAAKGAAVALDWNSASANFHTAAQSLIANAGQDQSTTELIDEEAAITHLEETLTQVNTCPGERRYSLQGTDVVVQSLLNKSDEIALWPINGTFTLSVENQPKNSTNTQRNCVITASEGYNFDSNACLLLDDSLVFVEIPVAAVGTVARNSATLFLPNGATGAEFGREVVDAYFSATAESPCAPEAVAPGKYSLTGVEYLFINATNNEEAAWEAYSITAELTLTADSCEITSSEGDWSCQVIGNNFYGMGEASSIQGTITNNSLTYVMRYNTSNGESFYGYAHGERQ